MRNNPKLMMQMLPGDISSSQSNLTDLKSNKSKLHKKIEDAKQFT